MEKYECISVVGEGSYGLVMKCKHKETGQLVAIKKFIETEDDQAIRKIALREVRMLKRLRHENLVNMIEVFRRKRRFYLVFEFLDHTLLDELEENPHGLEPETCRQYIFQVLRGVDFCHRSNIVHRDVKPENVLVSRLGIVKLCDFGFARLLASPDHTLTDYVATRWYRAPELLVGDTRYGREVDIWATGCLFAEIMSGDPLFPGDSDIDQLFHITKLLGRLPQRHQAMAARNPVLKTLRKGAGGDCRDAAHALSKLFPDWTQLALDLLTQCLKLDPSHRPCSADLLQHAYFSHDLFHEHFPPELRAKMQHEFRTNPLLRKLQSAILITASPRRASAQASCGGLEQHVLESRNSRIVSRKPSDCSMPMVQPPSPTPSQVSEVALQVLHPSINNISLNIMGNRLVDGLKRSPQPPPLRAPPHAAFQAPARPQVQRLPPEAETWRPHRASLAAGDFSLPFLPAAHGSPSKSSRKTLASIGAARDALVSPANPTKLKYWTRPRK